MTHDSAKLVDIILFSATQNTAFSIFIVDAAESLRRRKFAEVQINIEIEHQYLVIVLHNGYIGSRGKGYLTTIIA